jgi:CHAD domain-containing protein
MKSTRSEQTRTAAAQVEREAKFSAWPGFEIPDLTGVAEGLACRASGETELDAVYYDTEDLRLIRRGVTLRRRVGPAGSVWTVKFPEPSDSPGTLRRREVDLTTDATEVPAVHASLVRAYVRHDPLVEVARLRTRRCSSDLVVGGRVVGSVDDDEVTVIEDDFVSARFREVEVELAVGEAEDLLRAIGGALVEAGAGAADPTPKLTRALGPRAMAPVELAPVTLAADPTIGMVVQAAMRTSVGSLLDADHVIGMDLAPEGVHEARVAARRIRSHLRVFGVLYDDDEREGLRAELAWLTDVLGPLRDADVLLATLGELVGGLTHDADVASGARLLHRAQAERDEAFATMSAALDSSRYVDLLERVVALADAPPAVQAADEPALAALPGLVALPWRSLGRAVADLDRDVPDDSYHRVRILVRRARYAAEVAVPLFDDPASNLVRDLGATQDILGAMHDATEAERWLRGAAAGAPGDEALVAGQLVTLLRSRWVAARDAWPAAWSTAAKRSRTGWLGA